MDSILFYDIIFLVLFTIGVIIFLKTKKSGLTREGWMYLYKTQLGVNLIDKFSKKHSKFLNILKYPILVVGFSLMGYMIYLLCQTVYIYVRFPQITQMIKAPPIMPLIPYFTQIFGVESFMPPFYFTYFLLALAIVAVVHEFSHGIFMRLFNVKIKSTGFAFLGPILGAFVEQDEKSFQSKSNFQQMVILGAGVFANIITALFFFILIVIFFNLSYSPSGTIFNNYASNSVQVSDIMNYSQLNDNLTLINAGEINYIYPANLSVFVSALNKTQAEIVVLYYDAPAIRNNLVGAITEIDGNKIMSQESLYQYLGSKQPGDVIYIKTKQNGFENIYEINLSVNPQNASRGFLGISSNQKTSTGIFGKIMNIFLNYKDDSIYYESKYNSQVAYFFYNLIWWIMMINLFVGLFNMLPLGILDGGRFFYLAILSITNKNVAEKSFKYATKIIFLMFLIMMIAWAFSLF